MAGVRIIESVSGILPLFLPNGPSDAFGGETYIAEQDLIGASARPAAGPCEDGGPEENADVVAP
jgi:hypothetical protein